MFIRTLLILLAMTLFFPPPHYGDTFTVREDDGNLAKVDARYVGGRKGIVAIERADGRIELIPQQQVIDRVPGPDPTPIDCETIIKRLTQEFGESTFRAHSIDPYVVGLVLSEPLPKTHEQKATVCLKKGATFMKSVEKVFLDFTNELRIPLEKPKFPLVLLIFETDEDFMRFATHETGGKGLSAGSMLGYYNGLTNRLVIRMSECHSFTTPLHEAIHQQVFNRGIFQRLAPVPVWFNEGIATGFESNGEKISSGPLRINKKYLRAATRATNVRWDDVVADDRAFRGDVLAGEAYAHAWSIHWFLVTKYRKKYVEFLQLTGQKSALEVEDAETRVQDFERIFGKSVGRLQQEFPAWIEQSAKKQNVSLVEKVPVGHLVTQANLAEVEVTATKSGPGGSLETAGRMRSLSHIRPMSYHITLETDAGTYAEWYFPLVDPLKVHLMPRQLALKRMQGAPNDRPEHTFRIKVQSALPESDKAKAWKRGELPVPVWQGI